MAVFRDEGPQEKEGNVLMCVVAPEGVHDLGVLCRMGRSRGGWAGTRVEHAGAEEVVVQGVKSDLTKHGTSRDRG
jgi:hypothetical protein